MAVDRGYFEQRYYDLPSWTCPRCGHGYLILDKQTLQNIETGPSEHRHAVRGWDPHDMESRFCAMLVCNSQRCAELVAIIGSVYKEEDYQQGDNGSYNLTFIDVYEPRSLFPAPLPFPLFNEIPKVVKDRLIEAAALIWQNSEASANQIRQAVESLMDCRKVRKIQNKKGKRIRLSLHCRIQEFEKTDRDNAEILRAVKWLGNSGSHPGGLNRGDVLDAFDMMEVVLNNLYNKSTAAIRRKAQAINKAKGPA